MKQYSHSIVSMKWLTRPKAQYTSQMLYEIFFGSFDAQQNFIGRLFSGC